MKQTKLVCAIDELLEVSRGQLPLQSPSSTGRSKRFEDTLELKRATVRTALVLAEGRVTERFAGWVRSLRRSLVRRGSPVIFAMLMAFAGIGGRPL